MPAGGRLQIIKGVLYRLKRSYGCPLSVYKQSSQDIDFATGKSTITRTSVDIKRAIVLPSKIHRGFNYNIGFLKANSNFTYGAVYTDADRQIILDRSDLPKDWVLDATDQWYIVYMNKRWELKAVEEFEVDYGYIVTMTRIDGAIVNKTENVKILDRLCFRETHELASPELDEQLSSNDLGFEQTVVVNFIIHNQGLFDQLSLTEETDDQL